MREYRVDGQLRIAVLALAIVLDSKLCVKPVGEVRKGEYFVLKTKVAQHIFVLERHSGADGAGCVNNDNDTLAVEAMESRATLVLLEDEVVHCW